MPAVHGVAGKAADRFCDNQVNLAVQRICDHLLKALAPFGAGASDAFVGIHVDKLPIVAALYVLLLGDVRENGTTQNYLIQHSAGSGKTNKIRPTGSKGQKSIGYGAYQAGLTRL